MDVEWNRSEMTEIKGIVSVDHERDATERPPLAKREDHRTSRN